MAIRAATKRYQMIASRAAGSRRDATAPANGSRQRRILEGMRGTRFAILLLVVASACKSSSQGTPTVSAEVVAAGLSRVIPTRSRPAPKTAKGTVDEVAAPEILPGGTNIRGKLGTTFGMRVRVRGPAPGTIIPMITRVTHPPTTNPATMTATTVEEWASPMQSGRTLYQGWVFERDWELVPGKWRIEVLYEGRAVATQDFTVRLE